MGRGGRKVASACGVPLEGWRGSSTPDAADIGESTRLQDPGTRGGLMWGMGSRLCPVDSSR